MTAKELFKNMLQDPTLIEKYQLDKVQLEKVTLHEPLGKDVLDVIKLIVTGIENQTPDRVIYTQIQNHFKL